MVEWCEVVVMCFLLEDFVYFFVIVVMKVVFWGIEDFVGVF